MHVFDNHNDPLAPGAKRALLRCDELAAFSSMDDAICRTFLTPEHKRANLQVAAWMEAAGMRIWTDEAGNCCGRYASKNENAAVVILGSHLDTVPNAGRYDGILGVLSAIEIVDFLQTHNIEMPFHLDVVGFGDEEGVRFGSTLLGSRAVAGTWQERWFDLRDREGVSMRRAMQNFGLDPERVSNASRREDNVAAYLELHIEQGPQLEEHDQPVGIVSSIAGARRYHFKIDGMAGHAGTVPMSMRKDALVAAAMIIQEIEHIATQTRVVATVGKLDVAPGSVNVIPGHASFTLDIRSGQDESRDIALERILGEATAICESRHLRLTKHEIHNAPAVKCSSHIQRLSEGVIDQLGLTPISMVSGAGHDAMAFDGMTDIGMLFVRCAGGVSHHPSESVTQDDVHHGLNAFLNLILAMADETAA